MIGRAQRPFAPMTRPEQVRALYTGLNVFLAVCLVALAGPSSGRLRSAGFLMLLASFFAVRIRWASGALRIRSS